MLSLLIIARANAQNKFDDLHYFLKQIMRGTCLEKVEVIIKFDTQESKEFFMREVLAHQYSFRLLAICIPNRDAEQDIFADYNNCYLQTAADSELIIPLTHNVENLIDGWDSVLLKAYDNTKKQLGHGVFTLHQEPLPKELAQTKSNFFQALTRDWIDTTGGFGRLPQIANWTINLHAILKKTFNTEVAFLLAAPILRFKDMEQEKYVNTNPKFSAVVVKNMLLAQAKSLYLMRQYQLRLPELKQETKNFDLIGMGDYLAERFSMLEGFQLVFLRYAAESNLFILHSHTLPLLDVIASMGFYQKGLFPLYLLSKDWHPYANIWRMQGMKPMSQGDNAAKKREDNISNDMTFEGLLKKVGYARTLLWIMKRFVQTRILGVS